GTAVTVVGRTADNAWAKIMTGDEQEGWASTADLVVFGLDRVPVLDVEVLETPPEKGTETATETTESGDSATVVETEKQSAMNALVATGSRRLNIRKGPGLNYGIVASAPAGATVKALGRNEKAGWVLIEIPGQNGKVGWVSARYLDLSGDPTDLPVSDRRSTAPVVAAASSTGSGGRLAGKLVFQESSGGPIHVYDFASGKTRQLTTGQDPAISPDGKTVAFVRDNGSDAGLYLIDIDGRNERRIRIESKLRAPAWSPDGQSIVFSRVTGEDKCRDVGHGICVPDSPLPCYPGYPCIKDFPLKIFDSRGLSAVDVRGENFVDAPITRDARSPDWSEGGIVYQSRNGLEITDVYEGAETRSVIPEFRYQDPNWQPGGKLIAFHSQEKDHWEIFRVNPDGSGLIALTRPPSALRTEPVHNVAPAWSPDGKHIIFLSNRSGKWVFYVMDADGRNQRRLNVGAPVDYRFQSEQVVSWGR
ncbi:MAG TPA: SH3 domain-containing protein, partial [Caldilineae bacterium]|nr:SH3 domain-containing protein [Caldilineae bacterium]